MPAKIMQRKHEGQFLLISGHGGSLGEIYKADKGELDTMRTIEKLFQKAKQQAAQEHEKRGLVCGDGAGGWLCEIRDLLTQHEEKRTFPTQDAAIEWGGNQIGENNGYLLIMNF